MILPPLVYNGHYYLSVLCYFVSSCPIAVCILFLRTSIWETCSLDLWIDAYSGDPADVSSVFIARKPDTDQLVGRYVSYI
jgi:hypothetical protein